MSVRVLIADDHPFYREGIKSMLASGTRDMEVIAEATSGEEAIELATTHHPDVILMDLKMPGLSGVEATREIVSAHPEVAVLILTMFDDDSVFAAVRAGARGYLLKHADVDDLTRAIESVHRGEVIFSSSPGARLTRYLSQPMGGEHRPFRELTMREHDVLALIARGQAPAQIARTLGLTPKTVRNYVASILSKLHVQNRAEAAEKARAAGLSGD